MTFAARRSVYTRGRQAQTDFSFMVQTKGEKHKNEKWKNEKTKKKQCEFFVWNKTRCGGWPEDTF